MQATYCNVCRRELKEEEDSAFWYVKPTNMGPDYRPPIGAYRHVSLCSTACLQQWAQGRGAPDEALGPALVGE